MRPFGKYRLLEPIASGGMAEVWRAEAPGPAGFVKEVALKLIRGDHDERSEFVEMFIREARLASRLTHGNIVQVFDFDRIDGRYYIAMELVRGQTLRAIVDRCRERGVRFGLARAVHVAAEIARALAYAHRAEHGGLVHRDVSPQNVLLSFEGEVKLADFGIARVLGTSDVTSPGTVKGKLAYMAPEQARGGAVDARADVFSLGVILWELCTGRRLFARDSDAAMLAAVIAPDPVAPPSSWNEAVPPELDAIVLGALARDPEARTASAEALATALAAMRLRLATAPEDIDLRSLLARLWPDRDLAVPAVERAGTALRPAPGVAATESRDAPAPSEPEAPEPPVVAVDPEAPTRTSVESSRRNRWQGRARSALAIASVVALAVAGARAWSGRPIASRGPVSPAAAAPAPIAATRSAAPPEQAVAPAPPPASPAERVERATSPSPTARTEPPPAPRPPRSVASARPGRLPGPATRSAPHPAAPVEPAGEATGTVSIRAAPWAVVRIDGEEVGETPFEGSLPARIHRLQAHHPTLGDDELVVTLRPGERFVWHARLARP